MHSRETVAAAGEREESASHDVREDVDMRAFGGPGNPLEGGKSLREYWEESATDKERQVKEAVWNEHRIVPAPDRLREYGSANAIYGEMFSVDKPGISVEEGVEKAIQEGSELELRTLLYGDLKSTLDYQDRLHGTLDESGDKTAQTIGGIFAGDFKALGTLMAASDSRFKRPDLLMKKAEAGARLFERAQAEASETPSESAAASFDDLASVPFAGEQ